MFGQIESDARPDRAKPRTEENRRAVNRTRRYDDAASRYISVQRPDSCCTAMLERDSVDEDISIDLEVGTRAGSKYASFVETRRPSRRVRPAGAMPRIPSVS